MRKLSKILTISFCLIFALAFFPLTKLGNAFAEETLKLSTLISNHGTGSGNSQEITSSLTTFTTDFGDTGSLATTTGWSIPTFTGLTDPIVQANAGDFSSETDIGYKDTDDVKYSDIGVDTTAENKFALLFLLKESGICGIESSDITIPANALYVLTFNVKVGALDSTSNAGFNAKLVEGTTTYNLTAIKTTSATYTTYAFAIQGNQYSSKTVKLQLFLGNVTSTSDDGETTYSTTEQIGYAAVDTIRLFSLSYSQFNLIKSDTNVQYASLADGSTSLSIENGYFNFANNQKWDLSTNTALSDFRPVSWTKTGDDSAEYGIVNTNSTAFSSKMTQLGITATNPNGTSTTDENVMMLYNASAAKQTITSANITLTSNKYYEISFKFNTPATTDETNKICFYIVDTEGETIYSKENVYSYTTYTSSANEWATFHVFIKVSDVAKTVNFIIKFGTDTSNSTGIAYVDDVRLIERSSTSMFNNSEKDKYVLTTEEGEETKYLEKGILSYEDLVNLDSTKEVNRSLAVYSYSTETDDKDDTDTTTDEDDNETADTDDASSSNSALGWYVIPSVIFGICLIGGLIIFYTRKIKIKKHSKKKKGVYDRRKTLNKQIEKRERNEKALLKGNFEAQLSKVKSEIETLEKEYESSKNGKTSTLALKQYLSKREKLQNKQNNLEERIKKLK